MIIVFEIVESHNINYIELFPPNLDIETIHNPGRLRVMASIDGYSIPLTRTVPARDPKMIHIDKMYLIEITPCHFSFLVFVETIRDHSEVGMSFRQNFILFNIISLYC